MNPPGVLVLTLNSDGEGLGRLSVLLSGIPVNGRELNLTRLTGGVPSRGDEIHG
jgi:hypothetical protein